MYYKEGIYKFMREYNKNINERWVINSFKGETFKN